MNITYLVAQHPFESAHKSSYLVAVQGKTKQQNLYLLAHLQVLRLAASVDVSYYAEHHVISLPQ